MPHYLPEKEAEQIPWMQNFSTLTSAVPATYGLNAGQAAIVAAAVAAFVAAYPASTGSSSSKNTRDIKNAAKARAEKTCRVYALQIRNNLAVSETAKVALDLFGPSRRSTFKKPPTLTPISFRNLSVTMTYASGNNKALPRESGYIQQIAPGGGIVFDPIEEADPLCQVFVGTDPRRLRLFASPVRSPFTLVFTRPFRGGRIWFMGRWANDDGDVSPFGPVGSCVIPFGY